jgi:tRNA(Arg) A34 adenosine deaminase TadA
MDHAFMARAIQLSLENPLRTCRPGPFRRCQRPDALAEGVNRRTATSDPTARAEVPAMREPCQKLRWFQLVSRMGTTSVVEKSFTTAVKEHH